MGKAGRGRFFCRHCGWESAQWLGFCRACGAGEPLVEAPPEGERKGRGWLLPLAEGVRELVEVAAGQEERWSLPFPEVERVLGGGLVPGSVLLLAGDPGIGKSTLFLQLAEALAERGPVLYVCGEESPSQVRLRAERLGLKGKGVFLLGETDLGRVLAELDHRSPRAVLVDSIQTLSDADVLSAPGSVGQVRGCALHLLRWAKAHSTPLLMAGHITKSGDVAGPQVLEHMVDVVLRMEGEAQSGLRLLRSEKNRFGSTHEVAFLEMTPSGLREVPDPSRFLLSGRHGDAPGSAVAPVMEGTRPLLVEVQAIAHPSRTTIPLRQATGLERERLIQLAVVLEKWTRLPLSGYDLVVNAAGGWRVREAAADLAVALAVASSLEEVPLPAQTAVVGEVGLLGEVRAVPYLEWRLREAARLGFIRALVPKGGGVASLQVTGLTVEEVPTVAEALGRAGLTPKGRVRDLTPLRTRSPGEERG